MSWSPQGRAYKRFPPRRGAVLVPMSDRASALRSLALLAPVKWRARAAGKVARGLVHAFGPRALPGSAFEWRGPVAPEIWERLITEWTECWGTIDTVGIYERPHVNRPGLALDPIAFVKLRQTDVESLRTEATAMQSVWRYRPSSFSIPEPLADGRTGEWHYLAISPLPDGTHAAPGHVPLDAIVDDIQAALETLTREPDIPGHWRPMHGDLTPWNLRRLKGGSLVLIDWEYAGWGPPKADQVMYSVTSSVAMGSEPTKIDAVEAIDFWHDRISSWPHIAGPDGEYRRAMLATLERGRQS
jgi:hypothetical protein